VTLDDEDIEAIAQRVAQLLHGAPAPAPRLVDAATLAGMLGVHRDWVYAHAPELGAIRLGVPPGRLRFDPKQALDGLRPAAHPVARPTVTPPRRRRRPKEVSAVELITYQS
jgi:hypothetical protein